MPDPEPHTLPDQLCLVPNCTTFVVSRTRGIPKVSLTPKLKHSYMYVTLVVVSAGNVVVKEFLEEG